MATYGSLETTLNNIIFSHMNLCTYKFGSFS